MTLEELKKLEQSATPGPWDHCEDKIVIPVLVAFPNQQLREPEVDFDFYSVNSAIDAQFIAASKTMVPKLIKAVEYILTWPCTCDSQHEYTCERCEIDKWVSGEKDGE